MVKKPKLQDAHVMGILHPKTFELPDNFALINIVPGSLVKVCAEGERFWVKILTTDGGRNFTGRVDNELVNTHDHNLQLGDFIELQAHHIYQIWED